MTSEPEWGPWIDHDGKGCPCVGQYVHCVMGMTGGTYTHGTIKGNNWYGIASGINCWNWNDGRPSIIRYRIRKPRAMKLLQEIVENPPKELIKEKEDA